MELFPTCPYTYGCHFMNLDNQESSPILLMNLQASNDFQERLKARMAQMMAPMMPPPGTKLSSPKGITQIDSKSSKGFSFKIPEIPGMGLLLI